MPNKGGRPNYHLRGASAREHTHEQYTLYRRDTIVRQRTCMDKVLTRSRTGVCTVDATAQNVFNGHLHMHTTSGANNTLSGKLTKLDTEPTLAKGTALRIYKIYKSTSCTGGQ